MTPIVSSSRTMPARAARRSPASPYASPGDATSLRASVAVRSPLSVGVAVEVEAGVAVVDKMLTITPSRVVFLFRRSDALVDGGFRTAAGPKRVKGTIL
jgi:hypothetical protein